MSFTYICILIRGLGGAVVNPAAIFVYITWPWRHFRRQTGSLTTGEPLFCHLEKTVAFEFSPGILFGGDCPLGCIAVAACYCYWMNFGWCFRHTLPFFLNFFYLFSLYTTHVSPIGIPRDIYSSFLLCYVTIGCPNKSARFNFLIKRIIYSKSVHIFISG